MAEYIEREAVCYQLEKQESIDGQPRAIRRARRIVAEFPAADVVPVVHGKWISDSPGKRFGNTVRLDEDGCPVETCHCSECGEWLSASDEYPVKGRFCPNCGARMEVEHD